MMLLVMIQLLFFLATAETTLNVPSLSQKKEVRTYSLPLTAENYLDPLTDENRNKRPKTWPERLTFSEPLNLTADEVLKKMQGEFRVVYHCDGKSIEASYLVDKGNYDGYINESMNFEIKENKYTKKLFSPGKRSLAKPEIARICDIKIERRNSSTNEFTMHFVRCADGNALYQPNTLFIRRVNETAEIIFESTGTGSICPDGKPMKSIYVPSNTLLISKM